MAAGPARGRVGGLVCLLLAGCYQNYVHQDFAQAFREARVVAIVPPEVEVSEHFLANRPREDWSRTAYEYVTRALEAEFEARGRAVVWIEQTPETESQIAAVSAAFSSQLSQFPSLLDVAVYEGSIPPLWLVARAPQFSLGDVGPLLRAFGGDLLVVGQAGSIVQTPEGVIGDVLLGFFTSEEEKIRPERLWVWIAVADRTGHILYFGKAEATDSTLLNAKVAADAVAAALHGLPKR